MVAVVAMTMAILFKAPCPVHASRNIFYLTLPNITSCWTLQNAVFWLRMLPVECIILSRSYGVHTCHANAQASFIAHSERGYRSEQCSYFFVRSIRGRDLFKSLAVRKARFPTTKEKQADGFGEKQTKSRGD